MVTERSRGRRHDVVIAGGGIAGGALATVLARDGFDVLLVEREERFRDRVRGEGIHPWGVAEAVRLGLLPVLEAAGANPLPIWQRYEDGAPQEPSAWADASIDGLPEMAVHHPRLQEAAIAAARASGATVVRPGRVARVVAGPEPAVVVATAGGEETIPARLVVGADGRTSATRRWLGSATGEDPVHHQFGGVLLDGVDLDPSATHEAGFPGGRTFVMPQGDRRARAYLVTSAERNRELRRDQSGGAFVGLLRSLFPSGDLDRAAVAGPLAFFPNADVWAERIAGEGVVLIGDAAGANDPSVGHGLSLVFRDVRELSELLRSERDWHAAIAEFARRRAGYFAVLRQHAMWLGALTTEEGPAASERRERVERAREQDPTAGGFALVFARGPDGLVADEAARRRFFGEDAA